MMITMEMLHENVLCKFIIDTDIDIMMITLGYVNDIYVYDRNKIVR